MIEVFLRVVPPSVTAQQKRVRVVHGKPVFFHGAKMRAEANTWASLLNGRQPLAPMAGPVALAIRLVYPHLKATPKRDLERFIPKVSKPDAGNAGKHLEDVLVKLRFLEDDQQVARLTVEKWHGPESQVGIGIKIEPLSGQENGTYVL